jgi:cell wall-associated NlpC family hydrolase
MESSPINEPLLADDDLDPDEDDFDTVAFSDPADAVLDEPVGEDGDDQTVAEAPPEEPASADAPLVEPDPEFDPSLIPGLEGLDPSLLVPLIDEIAPDRDVRRRWLARLRVREQLLADAEHELSTATTQAARAAAREKVAKRKEQVAYAKRVLERQKTTVIERVIRAAMLAIDHREAIHYTMDSPSELAKQGGVPHRWDGIKFGRRAKNGQFPPWADCSSFVTWCYWDALGGPQAGPDILNGSSWTGGFTGRLIGHGKLVREADARPGDLLLYGPSTGDTKHVTMWLAPGKVASHGGEEGPRILKPHYRGDFLQMRRYIG